MGTTLVFGAAGFVGRQILSTFPAAIGCSADIADPAAVRAALEQYQPDVVINCAGKTGHPNIDWCETHQRETLRNNVTGALILLDACLSQSCFLVQLSSGCLYQGHGSGPGFREEDTPNFFGSYYARSKILVEQALTEFPVLILRPRMPFNATLHPRTLIGKLARYARVLDADNSLTFLPDFLTAMGALIEQRTTGIFNVVNPGVTSPYEIMQSYRRIVDPDHQFERLRVEQLGEVTAAARSNCVLSIEKLLRHGVSPRPVKQAIEESLRRIAEAQKLQQDHASEQQQTQSQ